MTSIGYPLGIEDGARLYRIEGQFLRVPWDGARQSDAGQSFGDVVHDDTRFGLGVSGGAWIADPVDGQTATGNRVVGLNATTATKTGNSGAALGACTAELLEFLRKSCPKP